MRKQRIIICMFILCTFLMLGVLVFLRLRGGARIRPDTLYDLTEQVIFYRQDGEVWAVDHLGDSSYTMKTSGCLVTCIASAVSVNGEPVTPGELNTLFSENAVYDSEGNIQWSNLAALDGYHVKVYSDVSTADIEQCLADDHYPIVRVRNHGVGRHHYVLIVGTVDGEYLCMDPLQDNLTKLSDYLGLVYAVRCVWKED